MMRYESLTREAKQPSFRETMTRTWSLYFAQKTIFGCVYLLGSFFPCRSRINLSTFRAKVAFASCSAFCRILGKISSAVAICGAKTFRGPCQAMPMANGRCRAHGGCSTGPKTDAGRATLARRRSESAHKRHAALRASGRPARFGELTPQRLEAQRSAKAGKPLSVDTKTRISEGMKAAHAHKQKQRLEALLAQFRTGRAVSAIEIASNGAMCSSVFAPTRKAA